MDGAEQHSLALAANSIRWLLSQADLPHPGLRAHLTAASVQITACQALFDLEKP